MIFTKMCHALIHLQKKGGLSAFVVHTEPFNLYGHRFTYVNMVTGVESRIIDAMHTGYKL